MAPPVRWSYFQITYATTKIHCSLKKILKLRPKPPEAAESNVLLHLPVHSLVSCRKNPLLTPATSMAVRMAPKSLTLALGLALPCLIWCPFPLCPATAFVWQLLKLTEHFPALRPFPCGCSLSLENRFLGILVSIPFSQRCLSWPPYLKHPITSCPSLSFIFSHSASFLSSNDYNLQLLCLFRSLSLQFPSHELHKNYVFVSASWSLEPCKMSGLQCLLSVWTHIMGRIHIKPILRTVCLVACQQLLIYPLPTWPSYIMLQTIYWDATQGLI